MVNPRTHLVGGIAVLNNPISTYDDGVNVLVLEERADHGVAWEYGGMSDVSKKGEKSRIYRSCRTGYQAWTIRGMSGASLGGRLDFGLAT